MSSQGLAGTPEAEADCVTVADTLQEICHLINALTLALDSYQLDIEKMSPLVFLAQQAGERLEHLRFRIRAGGGKAVLT